MAIHLVNMLKKLAYIELYKLLIIQIHIKGKVMNITDNEKEILINISNETNSKYKVENINTLLLLNNGYSAKEIASILNIKEHYVQIYKNRYSKYGINKFLKDLSVERISFEFKDKGHGWIVLNVNFKNVIIKVQLSSIFDPFDDILHWLEEINNGNKSSMIKIDEEGTIKLLSLTYLPQYKTDLYEFRICGISGEFGEFDIKKVVDKNIFLKKFTSALNIFAENSSDISWRTDINLPEMIIKRMKNIKLDD